MFCPASTEDFALFIHFLPLIPQEFRHRPRRFISLARRSGTCSAQNRSREPDRNISIAKKLVFTTLVWAALPART